MDVRHLRFNRFAYEHVKWCKIGRNVENTAFSLGYGSGVMKVPRKFQLLPAPEISITLKPNRTKQGTEEFLRCAFDVLLFPK